MQRWTSSLTFSPVGPDWSCGGNLRMSRGRGSESSCWRAERQMNMIETHLVVLHFFSLNRFATLSCVKCRFDSTKNEPCEVTYKVFDEFGAFGEPVKWKFDVIFEQQLPKSWSSYFRRSNTVGNCWDVQASRHRIERPKFHIFSFIFSVFMRLLILILKT